MIETWWQLLILIVTASMCMVGIIGAIGDVVKKDKGSQDKEDKDA